MKWWQWEQETVAALVALASVLDVVLVVVLVPTVLLTKKRWPASSQPARSRAIGSLRSRMNRSSRSIGPAAKEGKKIT